MSRLRKSRPSCPGLFAEKVIEWLYWDIPQFGVLRSRTLLARAEALSCYANVASRFLVLTRTPCVQPWLASSSHGALGYDQLILQRRRMRSMRSFALAANPGRRRSSSGRAARARAARRQRSRPRLLPRLGSRRRRRVTCGSTPHTLSPAAPANRISPTLGQTQMRAINFSPRTRKKSRDEGASRTRFPRWPRRSPTRRAASGHPLRRYLGHLLVTTCGLYKSQCSSCNFTICDENPQIKNHRLCECKKDGPAAKKRKV